MIFILTYIGFPVSIALLIENFTYHIFGYATGFFGNTIVAAHQIANVVTILVAMLPVAVSTAEAVRISNYLAIGSRTKATISINCTPSEPKSRDLVSPIEYLVE